MSLLHFSRDFAILPLLSFTPRQRSASRQLLIALPTIFPLFIDAPAPVLAARWPSWTTFQAAESRIPATLLLVPATLLQPPLPGCEGKRISSSSSPCSCPRGLTEPRSHLHIRTHGPRPSFSRRPHPLAQAGGRLWHSPLLQARGKRPHTRLRR